MIVLQSPIVLPGVLERELVYLSPRVAGAIESGGQTACELRTNALSPRGTNGERAGERGGLRIAWLSGDGPSTDNCPFRICPR